MDMLGNIFPTAPLHFSFKKPLQFLKEWRKLHMKSRHVSSKLSKIFIPKKSMKKKDDFPATYLGTQSAAYYSLYQKMEFWLYCALWNVYITYIPRRMAMKHTKHRLGQHMCQVPEMRQCSTLEEPQASTCRYVQDWEPKIGIEHALGTTRR